MPANKPKDILRRLLPRVELAYRSKEYLESKGYKDVQFAGHPYCVRAVHPTSGRVVKVIAGRAANPFAAVFGVLVDPQFEAERKRGTLIYLLLHGGAYGAKLYQFTAEDFKPREVHL